MLGASRPHFTAELGSLLVPQSSVVYIDLGAFGNRYCL